MTRNERIKQWIEQKLADAEIASETVTIIPSETDKWRLHITKIPEIIKPELRKIFNVTYENGLDFVNIQIPAAAEWYAPGSDAAPTPKSADTKTGYFTVTFNPDLVRIGRGRTDQGAYNRAVDLARAMIKEGVWDGQRGLTIHNPYVLHGAVFGPQGKPIDLLKEGVDYEFFEDSSTRTILNSQPAAPKSIPPIVDQLHTLKAALGRLHDGGRLLLSLELIELAVGCGWLEKDGTGYQLAPAGERLIGTYKPQPNPRVAELETKLKQVQTYYDQLCERHATLQAERDQFAQALAAAPKPAPADTIEFTLDTSAAEYEKRLKARAVPVYHELTSADKLFVVWKSRQHAPAPKPAIEAKTPVQDLLIIDPDEPQPTSVADLIRQFGVTELKRGMNRHVQTVFYNRLNGVES